MIALLLSAVSLGVWAKLVLGVHSGLPPVVTVLGLIWLATVGLPTSVGVAVAATVWGRTESMTWWS